MPPLQWRRTLHAPTQDYSSYLDVWGERWCPEVSRSRGSSPGTQGGTSLFYQLAPSGAFSLSVFAGGPATGGPVVRPENKGISRGPRRQNEVEAKLINQLKLTKELPASERGLAALIGGVSKTTVRRAVHSLAAAGLVGLEVSKNGTTVRLL